MKTRHFTAASAVGLFVSTVSFAQVSDLPVKLGDSVESVQASLRTDAKPEPSQSAVTQGATALRLRTRGIWVFFDKEGKTYLIRLDAPFVGNIRGVKIGSTNAFLTEKLGPPAKTIKGSFAIPGQIEPVIYYLDDNTTTRFNFDRDGQIETISISK